MKTKQHGPRVKHVPQRTCIACRTVNSKRGMVRIVRTPTGTVEIDPTGKRSGRGAYLCRTRQCWVVAQQRKALEYALKTVISLEDKTTLQAFSDTLPESDEVAPSAEAGPAGPLGTEPAPATPPTEAG